MDEGIMYDERLLVPLLPPIGNRHPLSAYGSRLTAPNDGRRTMYDERPRLSAQACGVLALGNCSCRACPFEFLRACPELAEGSSIRSTSSTILSCRALHGASDSSFASDSFDPLHDKRAAERSVQQD